MGREAGIGRELAAFALFVYFLLNLEIAWAGKLF